MLPPNPESIVNIYPAYSFKGKRKYISENKSVLVFCLYHRNFNYVGN